MILKRDLCWQNLWFSDTFVFHICLQVVYKIVCIVFLCSVWRCRVCSSNSQLYSELNQNHTFKTVSCTALRKSSEWMEQWGSCSELQAYCCLDNPFHQLLHKVNDGPFKLSGCTVGKKLKGVLHRHQFPLDWGKLNPWLFISEDLLAIWHFYCHCVLDIKAKTWP